MAEAAVNEKNIPAPQFGPDEDGVNPDLFATGAHVRRFAEGHGMTVNWNSGNLVDESGYFFPISCWLLDWWSEGLMRRLQIDFDRGLTVYSSAWGYDERARAVLGPGELPRRAYGLGLPVDEEMLASTLELARQDALWFTKATLHQIEP